MSKFTQFLVGETTNLAIGYLAGLSASTLVSQFFVRKKMGNLWGLAAQREAVSRDDYDWLIFGSSYLIGLVVMVLVNYLMKTLRGPQKPTEEP